MTGYHMVVDGIPRPQGSMRIVAPRRMTSDNPGLKQWRQLVADAAIARRGDGPLLDGPLRLFVEFYLPRPASHYGAGRNVDTVRPSAPGRPATKPDLDKLVRAIGDALTGTWMVEDSRIVEVIARKWWADRTDGPGAVISLLAIEVHE